MEIFPDIQSWMGRGSSNCIAGSNENRSQLHSWGFPKKIYEELAAIWQMTLQNSLGYNNRCKWRTVCPYKTEMLCVVYTSLTIQKTSVTLQIKFNQRHRPQGIFSKDGGKTCGPGEGWNIFNGVLVCICNGKLLYCGVQHIWTMQYVSQTQTDKHATIIWSF